MKRNKYRLNIHFGKIVLVLLLVLGQILTVNSNKVEASGVTSVPKGSKVMFANSEWIMVNPSKGKLILANPPPTLRQQWHPTSGQNQYATSKIRGYLNDEVNGFLSTIPSSLRGLIQDAIWNVGADGEESLLTVVDKVGLISKSEYESNVGSVFNSEGDGYGWWTTTRVNGTDTFVWYIASGYVGMGEVYAAAYVRPMIHLNVNLRVQNNGENYNVIINSIPTITTTSPVQNSYFSKINQA